MNEEDYERWNARVPGDDEVEHFLFGVIVGWVGGCFITGLGLTLIVAMSR